MNFKKVLSLLLIAVIVMAALSGCGSKPKEEDTQKQEQEQEQEKEIPAVRTVTDLQGRTVELPGKVERVASLGTAARMMTYAGCADKIVGCSDLEKQGQPGMPYAYVNKANFEKCTSISSGGSGDTIYDEALITLAPEVIFYFGADKEKLNALQEKTQIPVVGLFAKSFNDEAFYKSLKLIGEIMGTEEQADKVVSSIQGWVEDLNNRTKDIPDDKKPTVYTAALGFRGPHGFDGTSANFPPFMAVNAKNVVDETGEKGTVLIDLEKVTEWDPEYVFLNPSSMNLVNENYAVNSAFYENLRAVKEEKVYSLVSYNYNATNQELAIVDAYFVGSTIFPDKFADVDFNKKAEEIFETMVGMKYLDILKENNMGFGKLTIGK